MNATQFVEKFVLVGKHHRCPLIPFRERCKSQGLTTWQVLAAIRSKYGNGCVSQGIPSPWLDECRLTMPDGSRPRGFKGFALDYLAPARSPFVERIWEHLPFKGPVAQFPIPVTAHQLAGASRSPSIALVRIKGGVWIARDVDIWQYREVMQLAKKKRLARQERTDKQHYRESYDLTFQPKPKQLPPFTSKIWPYLPYKGKVANFPIHVTQSQLAGACKAHYVAMIARNDSVWVVRFIDHEYDHVVSLRKDGRGWTLGGTCLNKEERNELWQEYLEIFPHPPKVAS